MIALYRLIVVFFITLFLSASSAWTKPLPPPELIEILETNSEFESSYEKEEWKEVKKMLLELEGMLMENHEYVEKSEVQINDFDFAPLVKKMMAAIDKKDKEEIEKLYIFYQKSLFSYMSQFDYTYHPVLITIQKYISDEAKEAAEKGDLSEVESELKEILILQQKAEDILREKGVTDTELKRFMFQLRKTLNDCGQEDLAKVKEGIANLETIFQVFLEKAHN